MLRKYTYRRTLPHYQKDHKAIFATFSTHHRWHLPETARGIVVDACRHLDATKCTLHGFVVMPDHVHLVFTPLTDGDGPISLPEILQKVKSESAHRINKLLGQTDTSGKTSPSIMCSAARRASTPSLNTFG